MPCSIVAGASSSSDRAERLASVAARSASSAEQSAILPSSAAQPGLSSIPDVQRWLAQEPIVNCNSAVVQRVRKAVAVLSQPKPRQEDVQPLQCEWRVAQKSNKKRKLLAVVIQECQEQVINAAKKLQQQLPEIAQQPAEDASQLTVQSKSNSSSSFDNSSAAPPAPQLNVPQAASDCQGLRECNDWLQTFSSQEISKNQPLQRLQRALFLLQSRSSRKQRGDVHHMLGDWNVSQRKTTLELATGVRRHRKYDQLKAELVVKLVEETHRLQRMEHVANADDPASSAGAWFSNIQAAHHRISV